MTEDEIKQKLDQLAELATAADVLALDRKKLVDQVLAPVQAQLDEINAEFRPQFEANGKAGDALVEEIKKAVIEHRAAVKGTILHAVYIPGRVTWDSRQLDGLIMLLPELAKARKVGEPSVTIRPRSP